MAERMEGDQFLATRMGATWQNGRRTSFAGHPQQTGMVVSHASPSTPIGTSLSLHFLLYVNKTSKDHHLHASRARFAFPLCISSSVLSFVRVSLFSAVPFSACGAFVWAGSCRGFRVVLLGI